MIPHAERGKGLPWPQSFQALCDAYGRDYPRIGRAVGLDPTTVWRYYRDQQEPGVKAAKKIRDATGWGEAEMPRRAERRQIYRSIGKGAVGYVYEQLLLNVGELYAAARPENVAKRSVDELRDWHALRMLRVGKLTRMITRTMGLDYEHANAAAANLMENRDQPMRAGWLRSQEGALR